MWFNTRTHHGIFDEVLEADDAKDEDRHEDLAKPKLTFIECILALVISLTFVSMIAVFLVEEIEFIVEEKGVPDNFMGLILVPLVEKAAEHLTAIDEAWDNQMVRGIAKHLDKVANHLLELCPLPLRRPLDPDRPSQHPACRDRWLGP